MGFNELDIESSENPENAEIDETLETNIIKSEEINRLLTVERRACSTNPNRRSKTPFSAYLSRHSEDPHACEQFRSITPFLNRKDREKTVFELGNDIKSQLISHKMVIDRASVMDISQKEFIDPVRFITSDVAVVDRASVMDVSNVEVIYMIEEYDEEEPEIVPEIVQEEPIKKKKPRKPRKGKTDGNAEDETNAEGTELQTIKEGSIDTTVGDEQKIKSKKKIEKKKKKTDGEAEKSPSPLPKITLKLELGGGSKMNKKLFEQKPVEETKIVPKRKNSAIAKKIAEQVAAAAAAAASEENGESNKKRGSISQSKRGSITETKRGSISSNSKRRGSVKSVSALSGDFLFYPINIPTEIRDESIVNEDEIEEESNENELEDVIEEIEPEPEPEIEPEPEPEPEPPYRSPSPELPEPKPKEFWKKILLQEGKQFTERMQSFYDNKRDVRRPAFIIRLTDVCATEGDNIRVVCAVTGPYLNIRWFKDGEPLFESKRVYTTKNEEIITFNIINSIPDDTAEYTCVIANEKQVLSSTAYVNICEAFIRDDPCPPSIQSLDHSYNFLNDSLVLECVVHGIPRPSVHWYKDDYEIFHGIEHSIFEVSHGTYILVVHHPSKKNSGNYSIVAINEFGQQETKHRVEFLITNNFLLKRK